MSVCDERAMTDAPALRWARSGHKHIWCSELHDGDVGFAAEEQGLPAMVAQYDIASMESVMQVLNDEPAFAYTLRDARGQVLRAFGVDARLSLEAVEGEDAEGTSLRVTVWTPKDAATAVRSMDRFYGDWWVKRNASERRRIIWTARPGR